jgi:hypothetical protein
MMASGLAKTGVPARKPAKALRNRFAPGTLSDRSLPGNLPRFFLGLDFRS